MPVWWTLRFAGVVCFVAAITYAIVEALAGASSAFLVGTTVAAVGALLVAGSTYVRVRDVADDAIELPVGRAPLSVGLGLATVLGSLVYFEMAQWGFDGLDRIAERHAPQAPSEMREPIAIQTDVSPLV